MLRAAIDSLSGAYRDEQLARFADQRLYFPKDEEAPRQQQFMKALEEPELGFALEIDDDVSADDQVEAR